MEWLTANKYSEGFVFRSVNDTRVEITKVLIIDSARVRFYALKNVKNSFVGFWYIVDDNII